MDFGKEPIHTFHMAEGPGGFIEATAVLRNCPNDKYIGITLSNMNANTNPQINDSSIPGWKRSDAFLKANPNVEIENGITGTGDLLSLENFLYCVAKYNSSMMFITGDGGFDFSENFNEQEKNIGNLLFAQVAFALCLQKKGGTFILKIFDVFMKHTCELLFLLTSFYEKVYITKPDTSRYANSEKYLVCSGFLYDSYLVFYNYLLTAFIKMSRMQSIGYCAFSILNKPITYYFKNKLEEFNCCFGQQQIENISSTFSIIKCMNAKEKNSRVNELIKTNVKKCIQWFNKYNIPYSA
jgi:hypothetical protein